MQRDPYLILGLRYGASKEDVESSYRRLKEQYSEERFMDGARGNEAAKKLTELEEAYLEISSGWNSGGSNNTGNNYQDVEDAIKRGDLSAAQSRLDDFSERNAEWHYLQSVVFYKKNWISESRKQLEIAIRLDGSNHKYSEALRNLDEKVRYSQQQQFYSGNAQYGQNNRQMGGDPAADCCQTLACSACISMLCCR